MKTLLESIFDDDLVSKKPFKYSPKTKDELRDAIKEELKLQGPDANLNFIDVSKITDMSELFPEVIKDPGSDIIRNIDISKWNVSKVTDMSFMFYGCNNFNSDLSKWDVKNVENMYGVFWGCNNFNSDLSKWNVSKVTNMSFMFWGCNNFNSDLSKWNVSKVTNMRDMFGGCGSLKKIPSWYK